MARNRTLWAMLLLVAVGGCSGAQKELEQSYLNLRARDSSLTRPVAGDILTRTYRNPRYAGVSFAVVLVEEPEVVAEAYEDRDYASFITRLHGALLDGTARALAKAERFQVVMPADVPGSQAISGAVVCRSEALPHVTPSANAVTRDPVFGELAARLTVVITVTDPATGDIVLKYTEWAVSQWGYGPWAMDELLAEAVGITNHFGEQLQKF